MKQRSIWVLLVVVATAMFSCKKDSASDAGQAYIRVVHGVPNEGSVNITMNGTKVATIGSYGLSTLYTTVDVGTANVQMTGTTTLLNNNFLTEKDKYYTIVVADSSNKVKVSYLTDQPVAASGKAKINILHLGTVVPATSFSNASMLGDISANRSFNDQLTTPASAAYFNVEPGDYTIEARTPGSVASTGIIVTNTKALQSGKSYTFVYRNPIAPSTTPTFTFISNQ
jgi:hypothetical protein